MSQELQLGKYEFYPYPEEFRDPPPTLEELVELLRKAKAGSEKDVKTPRELLTDAGHAVNDVALCRVGAESLVNKASWRNYEDKNSILSFYCIFVSDRFCRGAEKAAYSKTASPELS